MEVVGWSPDETIFFAAGSMGIRLFDSATLEETLSLPTPLPVYGVAFSRDGTRLAIGSSGGIVEIWDLSTVGVLHILEGHIGQVKRLAFSPDGSTVAGIGEGTTVRVWDVDSGREILTLRHELQEYASGSRVQKLEFSPDGRILATAGEVVRLWDVNTGKLLRTFSHGNEFGLDVVNDALFVSGGREIVSLEEDGTWLRYWDIASAELSRSTRLPGLGYLLASAINSRFMAVGGAGREIWVLDRDTGRQVQTIRVDTDLTNLALSPRGGFLASADLLEGGVHIWELPTGRALADLLEFTGPVTAVRTSGDGTLLAALVGYRLQVRNIPSLDNVPAVTDHFGIGLAVHGTTAALDFGRVELVDLVSGEASRPLRGEDAIRNIELSPNGETVATQTFLSSSAGTLYTGIRLWSLDTGRLIHSFDDANGIVNDLAFSPDGRRLSGVVEDGTLLTWHTASGELLSTLRYPDPLYSLEFTQVGTTILTGTSTGKILYWQTVSHVPLRTIDAHTGPVLALALSPSSLLVASGGSDATIGIWELASGELVQRLEGHRDDVQSLVFSPDGNMIISGSLDGTIRFWALDE